MSSVLLKSAKYRSLAAKLRRETANVAPGRSELYANAAAWWDALADEAEMTEWLGSASE